MLILVSRPQTIRDAPPTRNRPGNAIDHTPRFDSSKVTLSQRIMPRRRLSRWPLP